MKKLFTLIFIFTTFCTYGQHGVVGYDAVVEGKEYTLVDIQLPFINICVPAHVFMNIIDNDDISEPVRCITAVFKKDTAWEMEWDETLISLTKEEMEYLKHVANIYYNLDEFLYGKDEKK